MLWLLVAGGLVLGAGQARADGESEQPADGSAAEQNGGDATPSDGDDSSAREKRGVDALGVPLVSYNSDLGWGFGLVGGGYFYSPGYEPYRHALSAQVFITTEGVQNHWVRYDGPSLIGTVRLEARGEYRHERHSPFYGAGNIAAPGADIREEAQRWSYDSVSPGGWVRLRGQPFGEESPLEVYTGYNIHHVRVRPYPDSALAELSPRGVQGGWNAQVLLGLLLDTRDFESDPTRGGIEEIALRVSAAPTPSRYEYVGFTVAERRFWSLGTPRLIFAQRFILDILSKGAPFFEWPLFGGTVGSEGIGGVSSVRGVRRNRYQGTAKIVSNSEMRFYVWDFPLFGRTVKAGGVAYLDLGRVWQPAVEDGPVTRWHPGIGTGVRLARRAAVARFDFALWTETWQPGVYVTFGHTF